MIKTLRRRFIGITMLSVFIVLAVIFSAVIISNYLTIDRNMQMRMDLLIENGGSFLLFDGKNPENSDMPGNGDMPNPFGKSDGKRGKDFKRKGSFFSEEISGETPFDARYFTATFSDDGTISDIETDRIYTISENTAREKAQYVYSKKKTSGYDGDFKYVLTTIDEKTMVLFLDCGRELSTLRSFIKESIIIVFIGMLSIFVLVVFFSGVVTKPIAESYEKQKQFITDASHEIKTPLAIIEANNEVVEMENGQSEWTRTITRQISRLSSLTEKLVFLSRMDEEGYKQEMSAFNLSDAILDTVESYDGVCEVKGKTLSVDIPDSMIINGNEDNIRRMLSLLMDNAIKYSSENGTISISATQKKPKGKVSLIMENPVDDIAPGNLDILFERFYRNDNSRNSKTGGHGIGLSVVAAIVRTHKGKIHAQSPDGHSIVFSITL